MVTAHPRTAIKDAILATVSEDLDADAVQGVEWAALADTRAAYRSRQTGDVPDWDDYLQASRVAL